MLEAMQQQKKEAAANANVKEYWENCGTREPFWGVLTSADYKGRQTLDAESEETFFASGADEVSFFEKTLRTYAGVDLDTLGSSDESTFLDLGCGVGRVAVHMARRCSHIVCVDIAESYLQLLRETCSQRGVSNFSAVTLDALLKPSYSPGATRQLRFIYSLITLQHNTPALIVTLIRRVCMLLAPGGYALLHAPYFIPGHVIKDFPDVMQMNYVPQEDVARQIAASGCELVHVVDDVDYCGGGIENAVYIVRKPISPAVLGRLAEDDDEEDDAEEPAEA